jgi:putative oxidoreductase
VSSEFWLAMAATSAARVSITLENPMPAHVRDPLALIARVLLALMFILAGFGKIGGFSGTAGYIASKGLPLPQLVAVLTIAVELGGGLAVLAGLYTRWAALALALFTLAASVLFHNWWAFPAEQQMVQNLMFMKNVAVAGGMLALVAFGAGAWSIDAKRGVA